MKFSFFLFFILLATTANAEESDFFSRHWQEPVSPQGKAPKGSSDIEKSLMPEDCGTCHDKHYEEWRTSRHARSMSPGIMGQMHKPWLPESTASMCRGCHSPLYEQRKKVIGADGTWKKNRLFDKNLEAKGITCAGCHMRKRKIYGPPRRGEKVDDPPHGGFTTIENFRSAKFCKPCHQFGENGNRANGKLIEDTYNQFMQTDFAKSGMVCADCHMPDKKHLWRGIHDPDMVKSGLVIESGRKDNNIFVTIENIGVGHFFPTYVTPLVVVRLLGEKGRVIDEKKIGWYLSLFLEEIFDTRIKPGESFSAVFDTRAEKGKMRLQIEVYPDDFYRRFFESILKNRPAGIDAKQIGQALAETKKSNFLIYDKVFN